MGSARVLTSPLCLCLLQPKVEEELSSDKVLESEQDNMSHGFQLERDPSELKKVKPVEENGEQEAEPVRNGAESMSEGEGTDATSGCTEVSAEGPPLQYKPGKHAPGSCRLPCLLLGFTNQWAERSHTQADTVFK